HRNGDRFTGDAAMHAAIEIPAFGGRVGVGENDLSSLRHQELTSQGVVEHCLVFRALLAYTNTAENLGVFLAADHEDGPDPQKAVERRVWGAQAYLLAESRYAVGEENRLFAERKLVRIMHVVGGRI